jgi:hypothetical protein
MQVEAAAKFTGALDPMKVWVDDYQKYTEATTTSLNTSINVYPGYLDFDIDTVNTAGSKYEKTVCATLAIAP